MLQAKTAQGQVVMIANLKRKQIEALRRATFFCPTCTERVVIKAGNKNIPHFSHHRKSTCPVNQQGEGDYHESGKLLLYNWLKYQHLNVEMELYIPLLKQRPDIFLTINKKQIAVEFQCARVSTEEIQKRNKGYLEAGITPIWILGANLLKRKGPSTLKVDSFMRQFIHQYSTRSPQHLYFFCPQTYQFIHFQHIYFLTNRNTFGQFQVKHMKYFSFMHLFKESMLRKENLYQKWLKEKRKFRLSGARRSQNERRWLEWLYMKRMHIEHLPTAIHLPIKTQLQMKTPLWIWQSYLCLELIHPLKRGMIITKKQCIKVISNHFYPTSYFPLIATTKNPLDEYLLWLIKFKIIKQLDDHTFVKINPLLLYTHIEEALRGDEKMFKIN